MEKAKKKKLWKILLLTLAALFVVGVAVFLILQAVIINTAKPHIKELSKLESADAVLVLGARVYADGTPSGYLRDRLEYGYAVYEQGLAPKIIVSGDHGKMEYNEVKAMKQYLVDKGVPEEDIFMDHAGFNTYDSMYRAQAIFGVKKMIVSTQEYHMYRAVYIARRLGIDATGYAAPNWSANQLYDTVRESLARVKAFLDVNILHRPPRYLGEAIPISGSGLQTSDEPVSSAA